jgi:hypothetical protein
MRPDFPFRAALISSWTLLSRVVKVATKWTSSRRFEAGRLVDRQTF